MLQEGEVALLGSEGLDAIDQVAHELGQQAILLLRSEPSPELQDRSVMTYAAGLPLVWVAGRFSAAVSRWAADRGPMTLLSETSGALSTEEQRRIDRFLATLTRQSE